MIDDLEENKPIIVECPHCFTMVLPKPGNICPACQSDIEDLTDIDQNFVSLVIQESEELPSNCHTCFAYTDRTVRVSGDKESALDNVVYFLFSGFRRLTAEDTSNVIIDIPQCDRCGEQNDPEPIKVDYANQTMTFVVQRMFRNRVLQMREYRPKKRRNRGH